MMEKNSHESVKTLHNAEKVETFISLFPLIDTSFRLRDQFYEEVFSFQTGTTTFKLSKRTNFRFSENNDRIWFLENGRCVNFIELMAVFYQSLKPPLKREHKKLYRTLIGKEYDAFGLRFDLFLNHVLYNQLNELFLREVAVNRFTYLNKGSLNALYVSATFMGIKEEVPILFPSRKDPSPSFPKSSIIRHLIHHFFSISDYEAASNIYINLHFIPRISTPLRNVLIEKCKKSDEYKLKKVFNPNISF